MVDGYKKLISVGLLVGWLMQAIASTAIHKSPTDQRSFRAITLTNGIEAILVYDPDAEQAAAALRVSIGSYADPDNHLGLAHFVEHLLFLGTKKYPEPGHYQAFIEAHGGSTNAYTASEETVYYFDILPEYLEPALERLSQFFIAPLFNAELVAKERNAVDAEFHSHKRDDMYRGYHVLKQIANPKHPFYRFQAGNLQTLAAQEGALRQAVMDFYQRYYRSEHIKLAIVSPLPLKQSERLVRTLFEAIPHKPAGPMVPYDPSEPVFLPKELPKAVHMATLDDRQYLNLIFPVESQEPHYKVQPVAYVSNLLTDRSEGGLFAMLYQKHWIEDIHSHYNRLSSQAGWFVISVGLTPDGVDQVDEIVAAILQYIRLIAKEGLQAWRYQEYQSIAELKFHYLEKQPPREMAVYLVEQAAYYPLSDIIIADYLYQHYNEQVIAHLLKKLTTSNMLLLLGHKKVQGEQTEPYFKVPYRSRPIEAPQIERWQQSTYDLSLPAENPYILDPKQIYQEAPAKSMAILPTLLSKAAEDRVWCVNDTLFASPKATLNYTFRIPSARKSPLHVVALEVLSKLWQADLLQKFYPAMVAGNKLSIDNHLRGLTVEIEGYAWSMVDRLAKAFDIWSFDFDQKRFDLAKDLLLQDYQNLENISPFKRALQELKFLLLPSTWSLSERQAALTTLTLPHMKQLLLEMGRDFSLEALIFGNVNCAQVEWPHKTKKGTDACQPKITTTALPLGQLQNHQFSSAHSDTGFVLFYQPKAQSDRITVQLALLAQILNEPFFRSLRTEQQLGYVVGLANYELEHHVGLAYFLQSPHYSAEVLYKRVLQFHKEVDKWLKDYSELQFKAHKASLRHLLLQKPVNRWQLHQRFWFEIETGSYQFTRREVLAKILEEVQLKELQILFNQMHLDPLQRKGWLITNAPVNDAWFKPSYEKFLIHNG